MQLEREKSLRVPRLGCLTLWGPVLAWVCAWRTRLARRGAPRSGMEPSEVPGGAGVPFARAPSCSLPLRGLGKGAGTSGGLCSPGGRRWGGEGCSGTGRTVWLCRSPLLSCCG